MPVLSRMVMPVRSKIIFLFAGSARISASFNSTSRELFPRMIRPVISRTVISGGICLRSMERIISHLGTAFAAQRYAFRDQERGEEGFYLSKLVLLVKIVSRCGGARE